MFECSQFDLVAYACPNRKHCYACDDHRFLGIGRLRFHWGYCDKYWVSDRALVRSRGIRGETNAGY